MSSPNEILKQQKLQNPGNIDAWRGPYPTIAAANLAVPNNMVEGRSLREGKFVEIGVAAPYKTFWWKDGYTDSDLKEYFGDLIYKTLYFEKGNLPSSIYSLVSTSQATRIVGYSFGTTGSLDKISLWCTRAGLIKFKIFEHETGNSFSLKAGSNSVFSVNATLGLNVFLRGTHYPELDVLSSDYLGWYHESTTGFVGFRNVTENNFQVPNSDIIGENVEFTPTTTVSFGLQMTISVKGQLDEAITGVTEMFDEKTADVTPYQQLASSDLSTYNSVSAAIATRISVIPFKANGYINIVCRGTRSGPLKFKVFSLDTDGKYDLIRESTKNIVIGINDLSDIQLRVEKGTYLGWYHGSGTGFIGYKGASKPWKQVMGTDAVGTDITAVDTGTVDFGISFTLIPDALQLLPMSSRGPVNLESVRASLLPIGIINFAKFYSSSALPVGWTENGGFTKTTSGLQSPTISPAGSWNFYACWNQLIVLDEDMVMIKFVVSDIANTIFAVAKISTQTAGTVAEINIPANKINLYSSYDTIGTAPTSIVASIPLDTTFVAGRVYVMSLNKDKQTYQVSFTDSVTLITKILTHVDTGASISVGAGKNSPGFIVRGGSVKVIEATYSSKMPHSPIIAAFGDSYMEALTIINEVNGGYLNRYIGLVSTALKYNISIMARGGETSSQVNDKLPLIVQMFKAPRIALYALGLNDTSFATWQTNMLAFKAAMEAKGSEVVLVTMFPRIGKEALCAQINDYVINTSTCRYIDIAKALTVGGDRSTIDHTLILSDDLHPNVLGHAKIKKQCEASLPDVFIGLV